MHRTKTFIKKSSLFFFLCLGLNSIVLADNVKSVEKRLTGESQKKWVFEKFEMFMGDNKCLEGEDYTFIHDNTVEVRVCRDGNVKKLKKTWRITLVDDLDIKIEINGSNYILLFFKQPETGKNCLILRKRAQTKAAKTQDKILCSKP